jgi:predicted dehydrogenase
MNPMMQRMGRRGFIQTSAGLAAMAGAARAARAASPNEKVRLGFIGCGGRAKQLMKIFKEFPDVEVLAVSDVWKQRMDEAGGLLAQEGARVHKPDKFADYRRLLERNDLDAVVIATTQHWHGLPFIHAAQAGKAIYVEKPLSHTIEEGRAMVDWAKKTGVLAMMGTQQRGCPDFQKAVEIVRSGELGAVPLVECWNYHNVGARTGKEQPANPPKGLDWDRWLGPAPNAPFSHSRLNNAWWFDYAGGMMTNWAIHLIDVILWAKDAKHPTHVYHGGGKLVLDDAADCPDTAEATWQFPGWTMHYLYRAFSNWHPFPRHAQHGISFQGTKATMILDRRGYTIWPEAGRGQPTVNIDHDELDGQWERTFVDCVKSGAKAPMDFEDSHRATTCCNLANISCKIGRSLRWDGEKEQIVGDAEAAKLIGLPRRKGYELPKAI